MLKIKKKNSCFFLDDTSSTASTSQRVSKPHFYSFACFIFLYVLVENYVKMSFFPLLLT